MVHFQQLALAVAVSSTFVLTGCGGSSGGGDPGGTSETTTISGTAEAPAGAVASFEPVSPFQFAVNFLISPVAAGITGLQPVEGATVELIRVNDSGEQQGEVLAEATTASITGDYNLEIPAGTSLAGNLVVRIQGANTELRAQAVDQEVDITPISEYVLQKFIEQGTELGSLTTSSVVQLRGKAEEFDIAAESDLSSMIAALETEMGDFIDGQVTQITSASADVTEIAGDWYGVDLEFGLRDFDDFSSGHVRSVARESTFSFANDGNGVVDTTVSDRAEGTGILSGQDGGNSVLTYSTEITNGDLGSFTGSYLEGGILSVEIPFEERIDGDEGIRYPPGTVQFQKAAGNNAIFNVGNDPRVSYETVDTNDDGVNDALDPQQRIGKGTAYAISTLVKKPTNATVNDLAGDFGRVYLGSYLEGNVYEVENEFNILTFKDDETLDIGDEAFLSLGRSFNGTSMETSFIEETATGESGLNFNLLPDGLINEIGGDAVNVQVNDTLDMIVGNTFEGEDGDLGFGSFSKTIMVRLPETAPDLDARNYRVQYLSMEIFGDVGVGIRRSRFDSTISFAGNTSASIDLGIQAAEKSTEGLLDQIEVTTERFEDDAVDVTVNADGFTTIVIGTVETGGITTAEGYFNEDGSIGIFRTSYDEDGEGTNLDPSELGLMILSELP